MSARLNPCKRGDFINALRVLGFEGPYVGTRHEYMQFRDYRLHIPSYDEYDVPKLKEMIHEVENLIERRISNRDWADLRWGRSPF